VKERLAEAGKKLEDLLRDLRGAADAGGKAIARNTSVSANTDAKFLVVALGAGTDQSYTINKQRLCDNIDL